MVDLTTMPLVTLADLANEAAAACEKSARTTVEQAAVCGRALLAAKDQCEHGQWMHWLRQNFDYDTSTARRYMQVAKAASVHNLEDHDSVASVLRVLADERAAERAATQPEPETEPQPEQAAGQWVEPAHMPPEEPPAAPQTIVDHAATREPQETQSEPQRAAQRAEPIEPEIVRDVTVQVFGRAFKLRVGRLYVLTPEGFDEVDE